MVGRNLTQLGRDALRQSKEQFITPEQAAEYVDDKHDVTAPDVRQLRKEVDAWRIYAPVYGEIRHHLAHNKGATEDLDALLAKTNIEEMKKTFAFLHALHEALRELHSMAAIRCRCRTSRSCFRQIPSPRASIIPARRRTARRGTLCSRCSARAPGRFARSRLGI
jgi:hypothetical protein